MILSSVSGIHNGRRLIRRAALEQMPDTVLLDKLPSYVGITNVSNWIRLHGMPYSLDSDGRIVVVKWDFIAWCVATGRVFASEWTSDEIKKHADYKFATSASAEEKKKPEPRRHYYWRSARSWPLHAPVAKWAELLKIPLRTMKGIVYEKKLLASKSRYGVPNLSKHDVVLWLVNRGELDYDEKRMQKLFSERPW